MLKQITLHGSLQLLLFFRPATVLLMNCKSIKSQEATIGSKEVTASSASMVVMPQQIWQTRPWLLNIWQSECCACWTFPAGSVHRTVYVQPQHSQIGIQVQYYGLNTTHSSNFKHQSMMGIIIAHVLLLRDYYWIILVLQYINVYATDYYIG